MNLSRRSFFKQAGAVALPLIAGCAAAGTLTHRVPVQNGKAFVAVADFPELSAVGGAIKLQVEGKKDPIFLIRAEESRYLAFSSVCTHLGCQVRKLPQSFRCPCHGSTYDLEGAVLRGPAQKPMTRFRTEAVDGGVIIF
ncbi:MAG: ubiquinol-cytochrome c reductase iron-sulfur subunit [Candidatus Latescibacteria bacterium]|nr:ubiquinol-cytochrome c reductase iron-sulfur subunit [Candidatus Latescibacterota bacterium]